MAAALNRLVRPGYGIYAWIALICAAIPTLIAVLFIPGRGRRRRVACWGARAFFFLLGSPIRVKDPRRLPPACVVVANHASYLDGIILTAALPPRFTFLIKQEMAAMPLAGFLLRRIGSEFVDREDSSHRNQAARRLLKAAQGGDALAFFPEGTFEREPGLRPFRLGAFRSAWRSGLPVVPVVIGGSRAKLPADTWLCSPGPLLIRICAPVEPAAFTSPWDLLAATRRAMLARLREPDLDTEQTAPDLPGRLSPQAKRSQPRPEPAE